LIAASVDLSRLCIAIKVYNAIDAVSNPTKIKIKLSDATINWNPAAINKNNAKYSGYLYSWNRCWDSASKIKSEEPTKIIIWASIAIPSINITSKNPLVAPSYVITAPKSRSKIRIVSITYKDLCRFLVTKSIHKIPKAPTIAISIGAKLGKFKLTISILIGGIIILSPQ